MHTAMMIRRLNAAEPTIVPGPRAPAWKLFTIISTHDRRISGADDPRAISVKFATVSFHILTSILSYSTLFLLKYGPFVAFATKTVRVWLVISSMAHMKVSEFKKKCVIQKGDHTRYPRGNSTVKSFFEVTSRFKGHFFSSLQNTQLTCYYCNAHK